MTQLRRPKLILKQIQKRIQPKRIHKSWQEPHRLAFLFNLQPHRLHFLDIFLFQGSCRPFSFHRRTTNNTATVPSHKALILGVARATQCETRVLFHRNHFSLKRSYRHLLGPIFFARLKTNSMIMSHPKMKQPIHMHEV